MLDRQTRKGERRGLSKRNRMNEPIPQPDVKVRALRGVCVGAGRNLESGEVATLEGGVAAYLRGIGAVEYVTDKKGGAA